MIEKIFIPTFRRDKQKTLYRLPKKWRDKTLLVVDEQDARLHDGKCDLLLCPAQGSGLAAVKEWIFHYCRRAGIKKYGILDDDIRAFNYCHPVKVGGKQNEVLKPEQYDEMFSTLDSWLDEVVTCGLDVSWNAQVCEDDYYEAHRQCGTHFFNGDKMPDDLDWVGVPQAEDFYLILQLLTRGLVNRTSARYAATVDNSQTKGGVSEYRTIRSHNESMVLLRDAFPKFVDLYYKSTKDGAWAGEQKLAARIAWKKALRSSREEKRLTIADLMST